MVTLLELSPPSLGYDSCLLQLVPRPPSSRLGGGRVGTRPRSELYEVDVSLKRKPYEFKDKMLRSL